MRWNAPLIRANGLSGDRARKVAALDLDRGIVEWNRRLVNLRLLRIQKNAKYSPANVKQWKVLSLINKNQFVYCKLYIVTLIKSTFSIF